MTVEEEFYIGYRDIDRNLKIRNSGILNMFEDISGIHASKAGEGLGTCDTTWLLTAYKVNIIKKPKYGDKVKVITWGTEIKTVTASREFEIRDKDNNLLIAGISNWAHINLKTKKLEKVTKELINAYMLEKTKTNFHEFKLKKLDEPIEALYEKEFSINSNWIDINNHMNNVYYIELAEMTLPDKIRKENNYNGFEIMYKKEIKCDSTVKCLYYETKDSYIVTIKNEDLSELHAIIKLYKINNEK